MIKQYEELCETGKCFVEQFEALRTEYCNVRDKFNAVQENNRELASRNAALLHEIEVTRLQLTKLTKDQLIKISGAEKVSKSDNINYIPCKLTMFLCFLLSFP